MQLEIFGQVLKKFRLEKPIPKEPTRASAVNKNHALSPALSPVPAPSPALSPVPAPGPALALVRKPASASACASGLALELGACDQLALGAIVRTNGFTSF